MATFGVGPGPAFPWEDWTPVFLRQGQHDGKLMPPGWRWMIELDPRPVDVDAQCDSVRSAVKARTCGDERDIIMQASSDIAASWPVQKIVGSLDAPVERMASRAAADAALEAIYAPIFHFKKLFNRARPWNLSKEVLEGMMFPKGHLLYPGHPSYPSGHAAQARIVALMYGHMFPGFGNQLIVAADQVAANREKAGFHFPRDSEAGKELADKVFRLLLEVAGFRDLMAAAAAEWPEHAGKRTP